MIKEENHCPGKFLSQNCLALKFPLTGILAQTTHDHLFLLRCSDWLSCQTMALFIWLYIWLYIWFYIYIYIYKYIYIKVINCVRFILVWPKLETSVKFLTQNILQYLSLLLFENLCFYNYILTTVLLQQTITNMN